MAFNFNWSPLTADAEFYSRAQDLLTTALNKSPKPPIIVDDILVNELNLGSVPPELEILEIGDLAEDRFRGIFKMCYSGDAFLTLKTRVQANPLNTYLFQKPAFASPQPLAASSGLTIPLQITLSEIKLSAFIILVFSKQKGLTLVFRNDPLESLKVSSTFDSIPFVCEYLQKEIEMQLRVLMMEELPAIIHRLSLRLWCPEFSSKEEESAAKSTEQDVEVDPLASPPQDAVDAHGNVIDAEEISSLSLEGRSETHSLFSQKNLIRLATLNDSQKTLSLFTPSIREAVFRAWAGPSERGDGSSPSSTPNLIRSQSANRLSGTTYTFSENGAEGSQMSSRPSLLSSQSATTGLSLGSGKHSRTHRKKKNRVVNLRKAKTTDDTASDSGDTESVAGSSVMGGSEPIISSRIPEEPEEELITPPRSPTNKVRFRNREDSIDLGETPRALRSTPPLRKLDPEPLPESPPKLPTTTHESLLQAMDIPVPSTEGSTELKAAPELPQMMREKRPVFNRTPSWNFPHNEKFRAMSPPPMSETAGTCGGIIEQAWMMKMAGEHARRIYDQKAAMASGWSGLDAQADGEREDSPPPAYEVRP